jgi:hypothetical protein
MLEILFLYSCEYISFYFAKQNLIASRENLCMNQNSREIQFNVNENQISLHL